MVLASPKLGFNPKSELPFVVDFQLPLTLNSRADFTLSKFCPLKLLLMCGFTSCLISMTKGAAWSCLEGFVQEAF